MEGNSHATRSENGPSLLPNNDPGNQGGGALMGSSQQPSQEDYENLFGPAGREVQTDPMRHKRHQRWHLPDVLKGTNNFLTDRIDGLISDATSSPFTSSILPYQYVENPDQHLSWDVWSYDEGLASRVPYESAARVLTQTKNSHSAYIVRQGLAISMEHNFMMSERGRRDFNNQLLQLVGSIQYTNDLDVHMALVTAPNYERTEVAKYAYNENDPYTQLRKYVDMFGMCQKNPNGLDVLVEDAKQVFKKWGASEPTFMLCNSKLGYQQNMTLEKTQYITNGADGIKRLKDGPDLKSYRDLSVIHSRHFSMEAGRQPRDLLNRRVRVAEHYILPPMTASQIMETEVHLYDEGRDQLVPVQASFLYKCSMLPNPAGFGASLDMTLEAMVDREKLVLSFNPAFWQKPFFSLANQFRDDASAKAKFESQLNNNPSFLTKISMYNPVFIAKFLQYHRDGAHDAEQERGQDLFNLIMAAADNDADWDGNCDVFVARMVKVWSDMIPEENVALRHWLDYILLEKRAANPAGIKATTYHGVYLLGPDDMDILMPVSDGANQRTVVTPQIQNVAIKFYNKGVGGTAIPAAMRVADLHRIAWSIMRPHIAMEYFRTCSMPTIFDLRDGDEIIQQITLVAIRPCIEHYMLGLVLGRGGTGELGATLWGQTELSCYDDAMHGKWGMNYKYHARAVVFNEKHLLRLWDVAFNGYTGGMGTKVVDFSNPDDTHEWAKQCVQLDEPLGFAFKDICCMHFKNSQFQEDVSNPINFNCHYQPQERQSFIDVDNIHSTHKADMDIFKFEHAQDPVNYDRYKKYFEIMPKFHEMHVQRKAAGHASHEGDTHVQSLSFSGTFMVKNKRINSVVHTGIGTGHMGESFAGVASIRAGNGSMAAPSRPTMQRIV